MSGNLYVADNLQSVGSNIQLGPTNNTGSVTLYGSVNASTINNSTINIGTNNTSNIVNVGSTSKFSTVNINSLNTNINGILTINGVPYNPFGNGFNFSNGYISQTL